MDAFSIGSFSRIHFGLGRGDMTVKSLIEKSLEIPIKVVLGISSIEIIPSLQVWPDLSAMKPVWLKFWGSSIYPAN